MKTYPTMNAKIVDLLRMSENPRCLYAAARIEELEKKIAALMADLQERDQALHVESEALGYADDRSERMEWALERACAKVVDLDFDYCPADSGLIDCPEYESCLTEAEEDHNPTRQADCWKKYFLEGDSDA